MVLKSYMKHLAMFTSVLALSVFLCTGVASAAPFQNASFELGIITPTGNRPYWEELPIGATNITGWAVTAGNVDYYMEPGWTAQDGTRSVDLNGREAGAIAQTFDTVAGRLYLVTFALAGNPGYPQGTKTVRVSAGDATQDYTFDTTGKSSTSMGWVDHEFYFTAEGDTTTLTFTSLTSGSAQGPVLDDVRVNALSSLPAEGTIGTQMTITASGFGTKKGKVLIGGVATKIAKGAWSDTTIAFTVTKVPPPGEADVTIMIQPYKTTTPVTLSGAFTVMGPEVDPFPIDQDHDVAGTEIIISGRFFSTKKGKVYLENPVSGKKKTCKVTNWQMDPTDGESTLTFVVPKLPKGFSYGVAYPLKITNKVGATQTTFTVDPSAP